MNTFPPLHVLQCLHLEHRLVERISKGVPYDRRPDLTLWICHFPLPSTSGMQCAILTQQDHPCPHEGPYGTN